VVQVAEEGAVLVTGADGSFVGGISKPWARDAFGGEVPTWFTVSGDTVTQHVDLSGVAADAYPVIADPWLGKALLQSAWVTNQGTSAYVVNAVPTAWGRDNITLDTHSSHVAELKQKLGTLAYKVTATIDNQFICHVWNNHLGGGATYNMESWRPNIHWTLQSAVGCNP
jgi:hypothetical protein